MNPSTRRVPGGVLRAAGPVPAGRGGDHLVAVAVELFKQRQLGAGFDLLPPHRIHMAGGQPSRRSPSALWRSSPVSRRPVRPGGRAGGVQRRPTGGRHLPDRGVGTGVEVEPDQ